MSIEINQSQTSQILVHINDFFFYVRDFLYPTHIKEEESLYLARRTQEPALKP